MQVRSNGLHLEVERFGPETGEPVLLVMGLGFTLLFLALTLTRMQMEILRQRARAHALR